MDRSLPSPPPPSERDPAVDAYYGAYGGRAMLDEQLCDDADFLEDGWTREAWATEDGEPTSYGT